MLQRPARFVKCDRRFAIRVFDGWRDSLLAVRVRHFIRVAEYQGLAIGKAYRDQGGTRLIFANGGDLAARWNRQIDALELCATVDIKEQRLPLVGNPHGDLILFFQGDHQRLAGILHPGGRDRVLDVQVGSLEQRGNNVGEKEENQRDRAENGEAANEDVPTRQTVFKRANTALALQLRRIEINSLGGICSHCGIGQIIHSHTLAILYDRKMTGQ